MTTPVPPRRTRCRSWRLAGIVRCDLRPDHGGPHRWYRGVRFGPLTLRLNFEPWKHAPFSVGDGLYRPSSRDGRSA